MMTLKPGNNKKKPVIMGLDISIRGTGLAFSRNGKVIDCYKFAQTTKGYDVFKNGEMLDVIKISKDNLKKPYFRAVEVSRFIGELVKTYGPSRCIVENYSFGSKASGLSFSIGEFSGVLKGSLVGMGIDITHIAPNQLKKAATGNSSANKVDMIYSLKRLFGYDAGDDDDVADAALLSLLF